jgi:hypothetical protein
MMGKSKTIRIMKTSTNLDLDQFPKKLDRPRMKRTTEMGSPTKTKSLQANWFRLN